MTLDSQRNESDSGYFSGGGDFLTECAEQGLMDTSVVQLASRFHDEVVTEVTRGGLGKMVFPRQSPLTMVAFASNLGRKRNTGAHSCFMCCS